MRLERQGRLAIGVVGVSLTGWAWQTLATSSALAPYSIAKTNSLISSPAYWKEGRGGSGGKGREREERGGKGKRGEGRGREGREGEERGGKGREGGKGKRGEGRDGNRGGEGRRQYNSIYPNSH